MVRVSPFTPAPGAPAAQGGLPPTRQELGQGLQPAAPGTPGLPALGQPGTALPGGLRTTGTPLDLFILLADLIIFPFQAGLKLLQGLPPLQFPQFGGGQQPPAQQPPAQQPPPAT